MRTAAAVGLVESSQWRVVGWFHAKGCSVAATISAVHTRWSPITCYIYVTIMAQILSESCAGILVALFQILHLVDSVLQVLLQPTDVWVQTHFLVWLQLCNHLELAVRCVEEPELFDVGLWEDVDCWAAVASLDQTEGLRLWWRRIGQHHECSHDCKQLYIHSALMPLRFDPTRSKAEWM